MLRKSLQSLEKPFFRTVNSYLEPLIRTGFGSPRLTPVGAIVLETKGRKTGRTYKMPVLASEFADFLIVSTVRSRSQWVKNLAATPQTRVWLRGQPQPVTAHIIASDANQATKPRVSSPQAELLVEGLRPLSKLTGVNFAVLEKQASQQISRNSTPLRGSTADNMQRV
jgi:deazaflavin-dependent oxidoreductase (nitroreductase family)